MSNKTPIFPLPESQHFSDYGFDPQIDYFQVLEEARKHKRETLSRSSIDTLHFKLQKPISKDDPIESTHKKKKRWWWKNALFFFKWRKWPVAHLGGRRHHYGNLDLDLDLDGDRDVHRARARAFRAGSISGPVYVTESRSGSSTPDRTTTNRPASGPLAGTGTPASKGDVEIPYLSLRVLNIEHQQRISTSSATPIYLVT